MRIDPCVAVLLPLLMAPVATWAQIGNFQLQGVTATQAVVSYTSPDSRACRIELSEAPRYIPVVPDVDPRIFAQSNMDLERKGTLVSRNSRVVVLGRRVAEAGTDGRRYSRALQAYTKHYLRITCGTAVREAVFDTTNIAMGQTYNDPVPGDPAKPGEFGWPSLDWADRFQRVVDPLTGLQIRRLTMSEDMTETGGGGPRSFTRTRLFDNSWSNPGSVLANDTEFASTAGTGWLFLETGWSLFGGGTREFNLDTVRQLMVTLNAWCDNCGTAATPPARTIEACFSVDGVSCAGKAVEAVLESCTADCTSARYRFTMGANGPPMTTAWDLDKWDQTHFHRRTGQVTRRGNKVTWTGGSNVFGVHWARGAQIDINNRTYSIRRVDHERLLTLEGEFAENDEESGSYSASNFGLMIRRKTPGAGQIAIQYAQFSWQLAFATRWESGGDVEEFNTCAPKQSPGPGGEMGWHCTAGVTLYWIGGESGTVNRLGQALLPNRSGPDGWSGNGLCDPASGGGPQWDPEDGDAFYCGQQSNTPGTGTVLVRAKYFGGNTDNGPTGYSIALRQCDAARGNMPCFELTNVTPPSQGVSLSQQLARMHPAEWNLLRGTRIVIMSIRGQHLQFLARFQNDSLAMVGLINPGEGRVVAALPSWRYWPMRWTGLHGSELMMGADWMPVPATFFRGSSERDFGPGVGPYFSRITSGPVPAAGSPCPARPADSLIPPHEWPEGERCVEITIDGEPGDPSPHFVSSGTVSSSGAAVTGTGVDWEARLDGGYMLVNGVFYRFERVSNTTGRLTPVPASPLQNAAYQLFGEPVNNPKTGNPMHAYLQDIEPRDTLVISAGTGFSLNTHVNEIARVILKQGNRLVLERGLIDWDGKRAPMLAAPANAYLRMTPPSCRFTEEGYCQAAAVMWNTTEDPSAKNSSGNTLVIDDTAQGGGHSTSAATATINSLAKNCPLTDGLRYGCYNVRPGSNFPERYTSETFMLSSNPAFQGRLGSGEPNGTDSHPSSKQRPGIAEDADLNWFLDARPHFGEWMTGSAQRPGVEVEEGLWKFTAEQLPRFRPKHMPTIAYCGGFPLQNLSGPGSRIAGTSEEVRTNAYSYCAAMKDGECREDSQAGDVFVSCPQISTPYCHYPGPATSGGDRRDICIMDNGAYNQGITQIRHSEPDDLTGRGGRILTYGLSQWHFNDPFWNVRTTPDGKWLMFRTMWANNKRPDVFLAKIPPFAPIDDQARNGYLPLDLTVRPGESAPAETAGAAVEFGYNPALECTTRKESCIGAGPAGEMDMSDPFRYSQTEEWSPVACQGGCTLRVPVIPQRVVYYRIRYFNEAGSEIGQSSTNAWAVP